MFRGKNFHKKRSNLLRGSVPYLFNLLVTAMECEEIFVGSVVGAAFVLSHVLHNVRLVEVHFLEIEGL